MEIPVGDAGDLLLVEAGFEECFAEGGIVGAVLQVRGVDGHPVEIGAEAAAVHAADADDVEDVLYDIGDAGLLLGGQMGAVEVDADDAALEGDISDQIVGQGAGHVHEGPGVAMGGEDGTGGEFEGVPDALVGEVAHVEGDADLVHLPQHLPAQDGEALLPPGLGGAGELVVVVPGHGHGLHAQLFEDAEHGQAPLADLAALDGEDRGDLVAVGVEVTGEGHEDGVVLQHPVVAVHHGEALLQRRGLQLRVVPAGEELHLHVPLLHVGEVDHLIPAQGIDVVAILHGPVEKVAMGVGDGEFHSIHLQVFFCRFFSLDKEKKRRKKRNLRREYSLRSEDHSLLNVLFGSFSFKKRNTGFQ